MSISAKERRALERAIEFVHADLGRALHELAGAASMCWDPRPSGVFDSQEAIKHVEHYIGELRAPLAAAMKDAK